MADLKEVRSSNRTAESAKKQALSYRTSKIYLSCQAKERQVLLWMRKNWDMSNLARTGPEPKA